MFDQTTFKVELSSDEEALILAELNKLQKCSEGETIFFMSSQWGRFEGVFVKIKDRKVKIECSLHKQYYKEVFGRLDNSGQFTISNARMIINVLFDSIGIDQERAKITSFEIGLNIPTDEEPQKYIEAIRTIGRDNKKKEQFIDANFKKNTQKTTEKSKNIKKVFKVYDKGFQMDNSKSKSMSEKILRIETIYKRQSIMLLDFFSQKNIDRITKRFYMDWASVEFKRTISVEKGIKPSQKDKAGKILKLGRAGYLEEINEGLKKGIISKREYRTTREFIRDWDKNSNRYKLKPSKEETEYRKKLNTLFFVLKD